MASIFSRSVRSLEAERFRRYAWMWLLAFGLLVGWGVWFVGVSVDLMVTSRAQVQWEKSTHVLASPVTGRVKHSFLVLGKAVKVGDVLLELESEAQRLRLEEEQAKILADSARVKALKVQIDAERKALRQVRRSTQLVIQQTQLRRKMARKESQFFASNLRRTRALYRKGVLSEDAYLKARTAAQKVQFQEKRLRLTTLQARWTGRAKASEHLVRLARLQQEVTSLHGALKVRKAAAQRLRFELERRSIRAPVAGRLGAVAALERGAEVRQGARLGVLFSQGQPRIVANFLASQALGRIRRGQRARLRLDAFPWTQYGSVQAVVDRVARVPQGRHFRVELRLGATKPTRVVLKHGMSGLVEVRVEKILPASLVLRSLGRALTGTSGRTSTK